MTRQSVWRLATRAITLCALGFLAWSVIASGVLDNPQWYGASLLGAVAGAGVVYAAALVLVWAGWLALVRSASPDRQLRARAGLRIYGLSQLYKYLPTNMMHYVGRHAGLRRYGIGHAAAALGGLGEIALLLPAAVIFAAIVGTWDGSPVAAQAALLVPLLAGGLALLAVVLALGAPLLKRHPRTAPSFVLLTRTETRQAGALALICYLSFFLGSSASFVLTAGATGPWHTADAAYLAALWAGAWAIGFVTPGTPGGIGVREALLIAGLSPVAGLESAAFTAVAMRIVTVLGDLLLAALGYAVGGAAEAPAG